MHIIPFIAYAFKGQVHVFAGRMKIVSHPSCTTSVILKYFCPLLFLGVYLRCTWQTVFVSGGGGGFVNRKKYP